MQPLPQLRLQRTLRHTLVALHTYTSHSLARSQCVSLSPRGVHCTPLTVLSDCVFLAVSLIALTVYFSAGVGPTAGSTHQMCPPLQQLQCKIHRTAVPILRVSCCLQSKRSVGASQLLFQCSGLAVPPSSRSDERHLHTAVNQSTTPVNQSTTPVNRRAPLSLTVCVSAINRAQIQTHIASERQAA